MKTKSKIWLGIGAFALVQTAGVSFEAGRPVVTVAQPAAAADGTCGWEPSRSGGWHFDENCERGERYNPSRYSYNGRGERWEHRDNRGRWERGNDHRRGEHGEKGDRWDRGERGEHGKRGEHGYYGWDDRRS